jgi:hypothetical protein
MVNIRSPRSRFKLFCIRTYDLGSTETKLSESTPGYHRKRIIITGNDKGRGILERSPKVVQQILGTEVGFHRANICCFTRSIP